MAVSYLLRKAKKYIRCMWLFLLLYKLIPMTHGLLIVTTFNIKLDKVIRKTIEEVID